MLVLAGFAWLGYGLHPRLVLVGWLALAYCAVVMLFGELLQMPGWMTGLSPFTHLPELPAGDFSWPPVAATLAVAAVLGLGGLLALRRRDVG